MSLIVQWSQYEQISTNNLNNISKYMLEYVLTDLIRYCLSNQKCVLFSEGAVVEQNTGIDYNVKVNPHMSINIQGKIFIRTAITTLAFGIPVTNPRIDIIQAAIGYTNVNPQARLFIDPLTGNVTSVTTYTQFQLDAAVTVKQGTEGTGLAPAVDSGKVKIAEVYCDTSGGIANADIHNVTSVFGENNTSWTLEHAVTTLIKPLQNHRVATVIDHPNYSITMAKLHGDTIRNARSFNTPVISIPAGDDIVIHEITVPAAMTLTILNMGVSIQDDVAPDANLTIKAGSYSAGFTPLLSTSTRNIDYSAANTFAATIVVQIKIYNATATPQDVTGHVVYTLT